jgi:hypothetical protein
MKTIEYVRDMLADQVAAWDRGEPESLCDNAGTTGYLFGAALDVILASTTPDSVREAVEAAFKQVRKDSE